MGQVWESPRPPDALTVVYTHNARRNGMWTWRRDGEGFWTCNNSAIGYRSFAELLNFYGPAYENCTDVPVNSGQKG